MKCNKCSSSLPNDSEFCQYCGVKLEIISKEKPNKTDSEISNKVDNTINIHNNCNPIVSIPKVETPRYEPSKEDIEKFKNYQPTEDKNSSEEKINYYSTSPTETVSKKGLIVILSLILTVFVVLYCRETQKVWGWYDSYNSLESKYDSIKEDANTYDVIQNFVREETKLRKTYENKNFWVNNVVEVVTISSTNSFNVKTGLSYNTEYKFTVSDYSVIDVSWGDKINSTNILFNVKARKCGTSIITFTNSVNSDEYRVLIVVI